MPNCRHQPIKKLFSLLMLWALLQSVLMLKVGWVSGWSLGFAVASVALSAASIVLFWALWYLAAARLPRVLARWLTLAVIVLYGLFWFYHWLRLEPLSLLLMVKNGGNAVSAEAVAYMLSTITVADYCVLGVWGAGAWIAQRRYSFFTAPLEVTGTKRLLLAIVLANVMLNLPFSSNRNEFVEFAGSITQYYQQPYAAFISGEKAYPYVTDSLGSKPQAMDQRPHVFIVMLESFSADYIDTVKNGRQVTPFFNRLKEQGLYVEQFYSASVETSKGQFATLCSMYPSAKMNIFTSYPDNNFRCLSQILAERGYTNVFMKAYHSLDFENTAEFVANNEFEYAHGMDDTFVTPQEREEGSFGWGIRDDIFYQKTFEYLDQLHQAQDKAEPFFVMTMSVTNHMMFDDIPVDKKHIYPQAQSHEENYANSMFLTDQYLMSFFEQLQAREHLKNSIVVVLGDNGFPMGQHGNYHNTKTHYNELFKTPLLIWWPEQLSPKRLSHQARSQLDVAPSVLDLLAIKTRHHFVGRSLLGPVDDVYFVPLIQPFDGSHLASIRYPYKYVEHIKTGERYLYNLRQDPLESRNLMLQPQTVPPELMQRFEGDIATLQRNEQLLQEDRIYPASEADQVRVELESVRLAAGQALPFQVLGALDASYRIKLEITPLAFSDEYTHTLDNLLSALESSLITAEYFKPGVNRMSFAVYRNDRLRSSISYDVYVASPRARLLSEMTVTGKQGWGQLGVNQSVRGGPLRIDGEVYGFGLGTHAPSSHRVLLNREYKTLTVSFGLDDESTCGDGAIFNILADQESIFTSPRLSNNEFKTITVDISGRHSLQLTTDSAGNSACDHTNWVNPVLLRADSPATPAG
ncbi:sulfatase-like hydrolase/transferase [Gilvimarinus sp. 1_MG-2023]|uniref:sulfatase-like hydrolase/transferase n=1 Tax=Gilvimarinus sp. 1_MG-2023 TaxID=3062638 RepID=UPI0026E1142C|nr:sulfatase-like hydrolase/transferase [Gilvimarinus sp. 1_MG-2023]MDO6746248.1 sulfatase-like hydrolase/transferase [Gilvimarinus sp. 1_MG-2023]